MYDSLMGNKPAHGLDESLNRLFSHLEKGVFHDELSSGEELLEFAHLIGILGDFVK